MSAPLFPVQEGPSRKPLSISDLDRWGDQAEMRSKMLVQKLVAEQADLSAVERFSRHHAEPSAPAQEKYYRDLIPLSRPGPGEQYAFEVDLDACSGCKACVTACHNLNGLDPGETWRSVGVLYSPREDTPFQQTVTTACHHCAEPGCLKGCPVAAYEKDPVTGIVHHLDDQCIGCQYCVMMCPYEVPQYSQTRGIVRKCDMCQGRLSDGEAPACVQSCPNEAIRIRVVSRAETADRAANGIFLPDAPDPGLTQPTTRYVTGRRVPRPMEAGSHHQTKVQPPHAPLVVMLVLTQIGIGLMSAQFAASFFGVFTREVAAMMAVSGFLVFQAGLAASVFHLGQPLKAWRFFLGLRTSWLSREILVFGLFSAVAAAYVGSLLLPLLPTAWTRGLPWESATLENVLGTGMVATGLAGVFCSVMVYDRTGRTFWRGPLTAPRFFGTVVMFGLSGLVLFAAFLGSNHEEVRYFALLLVLLRCLKLSGELSLFRHLHNGPLTQMKRTALLLAGPLRSVVLFRMVCGVGGGILLPLWILWTGEGVVLAALSLVLCLASELTERALFFRAVSPDKMPGGIATP
ncbi:MAG: DmsC/YnfH family molybdoenzyme membrane anchor subunit [Verrucomicrobiae bacterium]|nr:DmsC/YnfH family molybdoenzyme membrane anchor subunit [Verrucomicrobiae bacterium]